MATSHSLTISRPSKLQAKQPAPACVSAITAVASTGATEPAKPNTLFAMNLTKCKPPLKLDVTSNTLRAVPPVPSTPTKKRARKDSLDENSGSGDAAGYLPRVRQRLVSTLSVATIRTLKSIEDGRGVKGSSATRSCVSTRSRDPPKEPPRVRPLSEINRIPGDTPQRRLRRVGTIEFPTMHTSESGGSDPYQQPSRISIPIRPASTSESSSSAPEHARQSQYVPHHARESSSSYAVAAAPGPAPRASLDRFDLRIAPVRAHTELWDLPDDSLHAWPGILVLTDHQAALNFPPIHAIEIECATHAYEGRFSTETNAVPVFSTRFKGTCFSKEFKNMPKVFDPLLGIVMQENWSDAQVRKNQWYIKFWVPIPISLFRKRETRMFRLKASVSAVDDRMWKKVTVYSGTVVADISHLRKHKDMDGAAARC
ncbi:hypothetical protein BJV78DRAFT_1172565 [Lactifluus subvellereus]|nr:hypothetical protein BJV78DRAFT_1172565 [Lactifluus subvellereus]